MSLMRKFGIVKWNGPLFDPHMAKGGTDHPSLKLPGLMTFINDGESQLRLIVRRIEEFEGIFDIMNALAQKDKAVIVAGLI